MGRVLNGVYPGVVEATTDPKMLGRCRVRIHAVDGDETCAPVKSLPWAMPCFPAFMFNPPQVGDAVWVMFQAGDRKYPVYLGWFPSTPVVAQQRQRHPGLGPLSYSGSGDPQELTTPRNPVDNDIPDAGDEPFGDNIEGYETPAGVCETPPEVRKGRSWDPNTRIFKTWRGHTIEFSDHPEGEYLKIIDRSGQMILFDCAVAMEHDQNNVTPRGGSIENCVVKGIGEADKGVNNGRTQLPVDVMKDKKAFMRFTDLFGQYFEMWSEKDKSRIRLQSSRHKDDDQTPNHYIQISSEVNNEFIVLETREGHFIKLDETNNTIMLQHRNGNVIVLSIDEILLRHKNGHEQTFTADSIEIASDVVNKRLLWLENMMAKFNTHTHVYTPGSGSPVPTAPPNAPSLLTVADGTTVTKAG